MLPQSSCFDNIRPYEEVSDFVSSRRVGVNHMEVTILVSIGVLAAALGIALGRYVWPTVRGSDRDALARTQTEVARLDQECITLRRRAEQLDAEHKAAAGEAKGAGEE